MSDLRSKVIRFASTLPTGSVERKALLQVLATDQFSDTEQENLMYEADAIMERVGEAAKERVDFLNGEIRDFHEEIKDIDRAWTKWDWRELVRLGLVTREQADFVRDVQAKFSW